MRLDHRAHIFQNLNGAVDEIELRVNGSTSYAYNTIYDTTATVYHGNGPSKVKQRFKENIYWYTYIIQYQPSPVSLFFPPNITCLVA